ncbi:SUSD3 protein, partial [Amia calva]|nr:SUSD3 protein [Amia calva]
TDLTCMVLLPPHCGSFYVKEGSGTSVGSVLVFLCHEGYQLVGSEIITCILKAETPQWSTYLPVCEAIPRPEDRGLRVAVLVSIISGLVILTMSVSFIICCVQDRLNHSQERGRDNKSRKKEGKHRAQKRVCWFDREEDEWDRITPKTLSYQLDPQLSPFDCPLYLGACNGYENRGYHRSQENLLKSAGPRLYCEDQAYPHVVLQRVPTPTAPIYLHLPSQPADPPSQVMSAFTNPGYHNAHNTPQRLWP